MSHFIVLIFLLITLPSCKLLGKKPSSGGGGGASYSGPQMSDWLNANIPRRNSCLGMETDPTEDDIYVAPAKKEWKKEWSDSLYNDLSKAPYDKILEDEVLDQGTWEKLGCPNYTKLYDKQRRSVWITFVAELARYESGYDTNVVGDGGLSNGLLQLNYNTVKSGTRYNCQFSGSGDKHLKSDPKENLRCGLKVLNWTFRAKHLCDGKIPCAGGVSLNGNPHGYFGPLEGSFWKGSKHRQFTSSMRTHIKRLYPFCSNQKSGTTDLTTLAKQNLPSGDYRNRIGQKSVKDNQCTHITDSDRAGKPTQEQETNTSENVGTHSRSI